jgi:hypothetical protein
MRRTLAPHWPQRDRRSRQADERSGALASCCLQQPELHHEQHDSREFLASDAILTEFWSSSSARARLPTGLNTRAWAA